MKRLRFLAISLLAVVSTSLCAQTKATTPSSIVVRNFYVRSLTLDVVHQLAARYHVVIGVYGTMTRVEDKRIDIAIKQGTFYEALDAITAADSRFAWHQSDDGAIHVVLREAPLQLLDVTVRSFEVNNPEEEDIVELLNNIPEIRAWLQEHRCTLNHFVLNDGPEPEAWRPFSVAVTNIPFSLILDEVAARSHTYDWSVTRYSDEPCGIAINWGQSVQKKKTNR
jgi:hypothetical protein